MNRGRDEGARADHWRDAVSRAAGLGRLWGAIGLASSILLALATSQAVAASHQPSSLPCTAEGGETVRIASITDDLDVTLEDGRTILLAGIDPLRATEAHPNFEAEARAKLQAWLQGRGAILRTLAPAPDRWNRLLALLFAAADAPVAGTEALPALSVGLALVDAGLARARPTPESHGCWAALLQAERGARAAKLGLWADPYYAVREATDAASLSAGTGAMALVQGRVTRLGRGRSRLFIAMGGGAADFTLRLARRDSFILAELGLNEDHLIGLWLRARGFLDDRFGASIDITLPDQIEVVKELSAKDNRSVGPAP